MRCRPLLRGSGDPGSTASSVRVRCCAGCVWRPAGTKPHDLPMNTRLHRLPRISRPWWPSAMLAVVLAIAGGGARAAEAAPSLAGLELRSPDGRIVVTVNPSGALSYSVAVDGTPVLNESRLGLRLRDGGVLGADVVMVDASRAESDSTWANLLGKRRDVRDHHRELTVTLRE